MNARASALAMRWMLMLVVLTFVGLAAVGVALRYTPVPVSDIWAALRFYARLAQGDYGIWWIQHLEHRIVLPKLLYFIDWRFFGAREISLLVENFALLGAIVLVLLRIARKSVAGADQPDSLYPLAALLVVLCFSWMQEENLVHGFQVAFFLAYLVPLLAFGALAKAARLAGSDVRRSRRWFAGAVSLGMLSAVTMANGVLALPLLAGAAVLLRQSHRRTLILVGATVLTIAVFFWGYVTPAHHRAPIAGILANAGDVTVFLLRLVGSPAYRVFNNAVIAELAGAVVLGASVAVAIRWWRGSLRAPDELALLMFDAYALLSAVAAASGRAHFGLDYAFSSRYSTIALLAWSTLAVLLWTQWRPRPRMDGILATAALVLAIAFLPSQLAAVEGDTAALRHRQDTAALALELGARDIDATHWIFPTERIFERAEEARAQRLSIFSDSQLGGLRESVGRPAASLGLHRCDGFIETTSPLGAQPDVAKVSGWVFDQASRRVPSRVYLVAEDATIAGAGITGVSRPDVAAAVHPNARMAGFDAYQMLVSSGPLQLQCP